MLREVLAKRCEWVSKRWRQREKKSEDWWCKLLAGGSLSLPTSLIISFLWNWPWALCDAAHLYSNRSVRQAAYHWWKLSSGNRWKTPGSAFRAHRRKKKGGGDFLWPVILLSLKDMLMKLCSVSRCCHFQYFPRQPESAFHGVCYIYLVRIASSMCFDFFSMLHFTVTNTCLKLPQWF